MSSANPSPTADPIGTPLDAFKRALNLAPTTGHEKKRTDFAEAYPEIEVHLARNVAQKVVTDLFNKAYGHRLHAPGFRKMLEDERNRRKTHGECVKCSSCGTTLPVQTEDGIKDSAEAEA